MVLTARTQTVASLFMLALLLKVDKTLNMCEYLVSQH